MLAVSKVEAVPFQIALPMFAGELDELIQLALDRKLPTEDIAVTAVVEQYAGRLHTREEIDLDEAGEFLAAATRLLLLKSSRVLAQPTADDEALPVTVKVGWIERPALESLVGRLAATEGRECIMPPCAPFAPERRTEPHAPQALRRTWDDMHRRGGKEAAPVTVPAFVRLETAVSALIRRLKSSARISFQRLVHGVNRNDAVIQFLAVLELVRRREAAVSQPGTFAEITVDYVERPTDAASRAG